MRDAGEGLGVFVEFGDFYVSLFSNVAINQSRWFVGQGKVGLDNVHSGPTPRGRAEPSLAALATAMLRNSRLG